MLKQYIRGDQRRWDGPLCEIQFAINTAIQESTGFSPAQLNFGRHLRAANSLYDELVLERRDGSLEPSEQGQRMEEFCEAAKRHLVQASATQAKWYNRRRRDWCPEVGESVYKKNHYLSNATNNFCAKLAPAYSGPYTVINYISPTIVELRGTDNPRKIYRVHLKDVKQMNTSRSS